MPIDRAAAFGEYAGALARIILAFKFRGYDTLATRIGELLAGTAARFGLVGDLDAAVPIPSTRRRNHERGYDPAELLAREVALRTGTPLAKWLSRTRETRPQSDLSAEERRTNVASAFRASRSAEGRRVLLVDDVVTTGATAREAATALRTAGASAVSLLVLARTPEPESVEAR